MIKVLKLITGDDIISDIEMQEGFVLLNKPQKFVMTPDGVATMPMMPFSKDEQYKILLSHVLLVSEPDDDLKNGYNGQFGSGIVIAKSDILLRE